MSDDDDTAQVQVNITGSRLAVTDPATLAEINAQLQAIYQDFAAALGPMALGGLETEVPRALALFGEAEFPSLTALLRALMQLVEGSKAVIARYTGEMQAGDRPS